MDTRIILGRNVRRLRRQMGLSQEQFALRFEFDRTYISGIERGVRNPTVIIVGRLAVALDVEPSDLLQSIAQGKV